MKITGTSSVQQTETGLKNALVVGPVYCSMYSPSDYNYYKSGVYSKAGTANTQPNHAIVIIGWDDTQNAWWMKNSWGTSWGINGYGLIQKGTCNVGAWGSVFNAATTSMAPAICPDPPTLTINMELGGADGKGFVTLNMCANKTGQKNFTITREAGQAGNAINWSQSSGTTSSASPVQISVDVDSAKFSSYGEYTGGGLLLTNDLQDTRIPVVINVIDDAPPVADLSGSPVTGSAPLTVNFMNTSGGGSIDSFDWDFGDGEYSQEEDPVHQYINPGSYTVTLDISGPGGTDSITKTNYITVVEEEEPSTDSDADTDSDDDSDVDGDTDTDTDTDSDAGPDDYFDDENGDKKGSKNKYEDDIREWAPPGENCQCSHTGNFQKHILSNIEILIRALF